MRRRAGPVPGLPMDGFIHVGLGLFRPARGQGIDRRDIVLCAVADWLRRVAGHEAAWQPGAPTLRLAPMSRLTCRSGRTGFQPVQNLPKAACGSVAHNRASVIPVAPQRLGFRDRLEACPTRLSNEAYFDAKRGRRNSEQSQNLVTSAATIFWICLRPFA